MIHKFRLSISTKNGSRALGMLPGTRLGEMEEECTIWIKDELKLSDKVYKQLTNSELCGFTCIAEFVSLNDEDFVEVAKLCQMNFGFEQACN